MFFNGVGVEPAFVFAVCNDIAVTGFIGGGGDWCLVGHRCRVIFIRRLDWNEAKRNEMERSSMLELGRSLDCAAASLETTAGGLFHEVLHVEIDGTHVTKLFDDTWHGGDERIDIFIGGALTESEAERSVSGFVGEAGCENHMGWIE